MTLAASASPGTNGVSTGNITKNGNMGTRSLAELRDEWRRKVLAFLDRPTEDETIKHTQTQARISLQVIEQALTRYTCVLLLAHALLATRVMSNVFL